MAAKEAELHHVGILQPNAQLAEYMPHRTPEAIKGKRRHPAYKSLVSQLIASQAAGRRDEDVTVEADMNGNDEVLDEGAEIVPAIIINQEIDLRTHITNLVHALRQSRCLAQNSLLDIAEKAREGDNVDQELEQWLSETFPNARPPKGPKLGNARPYTGDRYQKRKKRYARLQKAFTNSRRDAARMVLDDTDTVNTIVPNTDVMLDYWGTLMSDVSEPVATGNTVYPAAVAALKNLWLPFSEDEVKLVKVRNDAAAGPDGIKAKEWTRVALRLRTLFFNVLLLAEHVPQGLRMSRTVFLAKKKGGSVDPSDFRPISITSIVLRHFHKILARRFTTHFGFDIRNSAYQHFDGVGKSVALLRSVLDTAWTQRKELHIACLDAAKAFNSVTYRAIKLTMAEIGCAPQFNRYICSLYDDVNTVMQFEGTERVTSVGKGVLQGDPLSGPIFMAVFQCAIEKLNENVGFRGNQSLINAVAYADDIVLMAGTRRGLQLNLTAFEEGLRPVGLRVNASKSFSLSLVPSGREKKVKVETSKSFDVGSIRICPKGIDDAWKYLGLNFQGREVETFDGKLSAGLDKISSAPLKPQQRLTLLRDNVIPGVMHRLVLGASTATSLKVADITLRNYVRKWLHLAKDIPLGFFYTAQKHGGLGLPCLQHVVPLHRLNRYQRIQDTMEGSLANIRESRHVTSMIHASKMALRFLGDNTSAQAMNKFWRDRLLASVDGAELTEMGHHRSDSKWCRFDADTKGEDFVHYHAIRINNVPSRDRLTRGRKSDQGSQTRCRGGCGVPETTYHAIQVCHRSKGTRMNRHNRVVDIMGDALHRNGYNITKERRLPSSTLTTGRRRQPDLIAVKDDTAIVMDAQVVYGYDVDASHIAKEWRYRGLQGFDDDVRAAHGVANVRHVPCTITYRGAWAKNCVKELVLLGVNEAELHWVVTSVLRGSWMCWRSFVTAGVSAE